MSDMHTTDTFTGRRMMDVRQQLAAEGGGMVEVIEHAPGIYTISTRDGRVWDVIERPACWTATARPQPTPNHTHDPNGCAYCASLEHAGNERHMA